jgi:hypothetical protein
MISKIAISLTILFWVSAFVIQNVWGDPHPEITNKADIASGLFVLLFLACACIGAIALLWGY